jgi:general secretion pathway protein A
MADTVSGQRGPATPLMATVGGWKPLKSLGAPWAEHNKVNGLKSFGLSSNPFSSSSVGGRVPLLPGTRCAVAELTQAIEGRKGLLVLTGEVGTGKTTVVNQLRARLAERSMPCAYLFNPLLDAHNFLEFVLAEFRIKAESNTAANAFKQLGNWLFASYDQGATVVLIVDEAQCLAPSTLQALVPLTNLESSGEKLLQVVLSGQPELNDMLRRPEFRSLRQQIGWRSRTLPLNLEGTHAYVDTRLQAAGSGGKVVFSAAALDAVHLYSRGVPRVIDHLCEYALGNACAARRELVSAEMVEAVAREFGFDGACPVAPGNRDSIERTFEPSAWGRPIESALASVAGPAAAAKAEAPTPEASENAVLKPVTPFPPSVPAVPRPSLQVVPSPAPARAVPLPVFSVEPKRVRASVLRLLSETVKPRVSALIARLSRGLLHSRPSSPRRGHNYRLSLAHLSRDWKQSWGSVVRWLNGPLRVARTPRSS